MRIIEPIQPDISTLTSSSISADTTPLWSSGTSYSVGETVRRWTGSAYRIYEALITNSDKDPLLSPVDGNGLPYWLDTGPTNRWAMFDGSVGTSSSDSADIVVTYTPTTRINSIALFEVFGSSVNVTVTSVLAGGEIYNQTQQTQSPRGPFWYSYLFGEPKVQTRFTFFNIPPYPDMIITVTIENRGGTASVGEMVFGSEFYIGEDEIGMEPEIKSYSVARFNETFGAVEKINRRSRRRLRITTSVISERADIVFRKMQQLDNVNLVWISDKYEAGIVFGFYSNYRPVHSSHPLVYVSYRIEGLI